MTDLIMLNGTPVYNTPFTIGKHPNNNFKLQSNTASRFHAEIVTELKQYYIIDKNSKNGVFLNGKRIKKSLIKNNDLLYMGNDKIKILFKNKNTDTKTVNRNNITLRNNLTSLFVDSAKILAKEASPKVSLHSLLENAKIRFYSNYKCSEIEKEKIEKYTHAELSGMGPLEVFLLNPNISEIMINGFDNIYVEKEGKIYKTDASFITEESFSNLIERIVSLQGGRLDENMPYIDTRLNDASRVNIIIPPAAFLKPHMTIRKFNNCKYNFQGLKSCDFVPEELSSLLIELVKKEKNILISGNTGSGKTTLLNALSEFIDNSQRIITIEDAAELELKKEHLISLQSKRANVEGSGRISIRELLKNSLRMRPDRIIIGECRGEETTDMIEALSTGHSGSMSTIHANSARDALKRIETIILLNNQLNPLGLRQQIVSAINYIIHTKRSQNGKRQITELLEVNGIDEDIIICSEIYKEGQMLSKFNK